MYRYILCKETQYGYRKYCQAHDKAHRGMRKLMPHKSSCRIVGIEIWIAIQNIESKDRHQSARQHEEEQDGVKQLVQGKIG